MSAQLIFEPAKEMALQCPFSFILKTTSGKDTKFQHAPYSKENLQDIYSNDYNQITLKILALLSARQLKKEEEKYASNYRKLHPRIAMKDYIEKYLLEYYFKSLR